MSLPTLSNKMRAQIASAASLESYLGRSISKSATESIDDPAVQETAQLDLQLFAEKAVIDAIQDGRIFFSEDPAQALQEFLSILQMPEVQAMIIDELAAAKLPEEDRELARYKQLDDRLYQLRTEVGAREKDLNTLSVKLIEEHPEWADEIG